LREINESLGRAGDEFGEVDKLGETTVAINWEREKRGRLGRGGERWGSVSEDWLGEEEKGGL
jgi:hypothetical protein